MFFNYLLSFNIRKQHRLHFIIILAGGNLMDVTVQIYVYVYLSVGSSDMSIECVLFARNFPCIMNEYACFGRINFGFALLCADDERYG